MADDTATPEEDKKSKDSKKPSEEQSKVNDRIAELENELAEKDEELQKTNSYLTKLQKGEVDQQNPDGGQREEVDPSLYGYTPEQVKAAEKVLKVDELREELKELKQEREEAKKAESAKAWQTELEKVNEVAEKAKTPKVTGLAQEKKLFEFMKERRINDPVLAYQLQHDLLSKPEEGAVTSDKPSAETETLSEDEYKEAMKKVKGKSIDEIAAVERKFKKLPYS